MNSDGQDLMPCPCCKLRQRRAVDRVTGVSAQVCEQCGRHQGGQEARRVKRSEDHEAMLRRHLDACRASEAKAQEAAAQARAETREARRLEAEALQSRGRLARRIVRADGPASLQEIARDRKVIAWAKRAEDDEVLPFGLGQ
jgi:hypothetical protein